MKDLEVALAKEACLTCGNLMDGPIIMNTKLTAKEAEKVKEIHGKCIGYAEDLCNECKDMCSKGLLVVEIDAEQSKHNNPYRTGKLFVLDNNSDFVKSIDEKFIINKKGSKFIFMDKEVTKQLGFYNHI